MADESVTAARFPGFGKGGGYESWYLRAVAPEGGRGVWIRYTVHQRAGGEPTGSLWFTLFGPDGPRASKVTLPAPSGDVADAWIAIGDARFGEAGAVGQAATEQLDASWELRFEGAEPPLRHLPKGWMYKAPLPKTKLLSPYPDARFTGVIHAGEEAVRLDGWRGMIGHNWGAQHAERWIWLHGLGFEGAEDVWIDAAIGRIRVAGRTTPWIANGAISIDGERHALGGIGAARATKVSATPERADIELPGADLSVSGRLEAPRERFVGWVYADPDGSEHHTVNCSVADFTLTVNRQDREPLNLKASGQAAYELGMRERDHGMRIQPFPDG
jgi:hypothetical protein